MWLKDPCRPVDFLIKLSYLQPTTFDIKASSRSIVAKSTPEHQAGERHCRSRSRIMLPFLKSSLVNPGSGDGNGSRRGGQRTDASTGPSSCPIEYQTRKSSSGRNPS